MFMIKFNFTHHKMLNSFNYIVYIMRNYVMKSNGKFYKRKEYNALGKDPFAVQFRLEIYKLH